MAIHVTDQDPAYRPLPHQGGGVGWPNATWLVGVGDLDGTALANLVRPYRLGPKQLGGDGNPRGYRLDDLQAAIGWAAAAR